LSFGVGHDANGDDPAKDMCRPDFVVKIVEKNPRGGPIKPSVDQLSLALLSTEGEFSA
jgi:hypothetical protein